MRAFDVRTARLLPQSFIDPTAPDEQMRGTPMTRAMSPDGRCAYTLYQGFDGTPFIHVLDTAGITARCIDLDTLAGQDVSAFRLDVDSEDGEMFYARARRSWPASIWRRSPPVCPCPWGRPPDRCPYCAAPRDIELR